MVTTPSSTVTSSALANMQGNSGIAGQQGMMSSSSSGNQGGSQSLSSSATTINLGGPAGLTAAQQQALLSTDLTQLLQLLNSTDQNQLANVDFNKLAMLFNINTVSMIRFITTTYQKKKKKSFSSISPLLIFYILNIWYWFFDFVDYNYYSFAFINLTFILFACLFSES